MSIKRMTAVWEQSQTKGSHLLLLLAIADHADDDGFAWPGNSRLSKKVRMSGRHIKRMLSTLKEDLHELYYEQLEEGSTNRYIVLAGLSDGEFISALISRFKKPVDEAQKIVALMRGSDKMSSLDSLGSSDKMSPGSDIAVSSGSDIAMSPESSYNHQLIIKDNNHHAGVDNLGTIPSDIPSAVGPAEPQNGTLPLQEEPTYSAIDEDGNDLRDLSAEALLTRIWRATKSFKFKATPDKKYYGQVQDLQRKMLKDKRWAEYVNHQITWCLNGGTPHLGAKRWFEETLDLPGFQSWLNRKESGENPTDEIDTSEMKGIPRNFRHRPVPVPYIPPAPPLQDPEHIALQQKLIDEGLF